jgi:hypothetical protein
MTTVWPALGAVNNPPAVIVPRLPSPQSVGATPDVPAVWHKDHATPVLNAPGPVTEAVNCKVSPVPILAVDGETCTRTPESTTTERKPNAVVVVQLVATTKKVLGWGGAPGAA